MEAYKHKVQYYETDQMGIVHHSNYIRWFEEARCDVLGRMGMPYSEMEALGVLIPVLGVNCDYLHPVRFPDTVAIHMCVERFEATHGLKFEVRYKLTGADDGEVLTTGQTRHCFVDRNMRPLRLKRDYPKVYQVFADLERLGWYNQQ